MNAIGTLKSLRRHIGLFGRRNAGKSSLLNALTGQGAAIVSAEPGTTTDPVEKSYELDGLGPVVFVDTAGIDDEGELGHARVRRSRAVLERVDLALLVCGGEGFGAPEAALAASLRAAATPTLVLFNKSDLAPPVAADVERARACDFAVACASALTGENIDGVKRAIAALAPPDGADEPLLVGDLLPAGALAVLVVPIDLGAPKGRLILPQVQVIREILDSDAMSLVVKERELREALGRLSAPPRLVICDSQVVLKAAADTPDEVPLTTFSILMARFKADLARLARGAAAIHRLRAGDRVLVAETCSHCPLADDIGRVKIPRWLRQFTGVQLQIDNVGGFDLPDDLSPYRMVIHCGSCMTTRRHMLARLREAEHQGVPMTNYGVAISLLQGVLPRVLECFPAAAAAYAAEARKESN